MEPRRQFTQWLEDFDLEVEGDRFVVSRPELGDVTERPGGPGGGSLYSMGITAEEAVRLSRLLGRAGRLVDSRGAEQARFQIEKVDPRLDVVVARRLTPATPGR